METVVDKRFALDVTICIVCFFSKCFVRARGRSKTPAMIVAIGTRMVAVSRDMAYATIALLHYLVVGAVVRRILTMATMHMTILAQICHDAYDNSRTDLPIPHSLLEWKPCVR